MQLNWRTHSAKGNKMQFLSGKYKLHQFFTHCPSLLYNGDRENAILIPSSIKFCAHVTCSREAFLCNSAVFAELRIKSEQKNCDE